LKACSEFPINETTPIKIHPSTENDSETDNKSQIKENIPFSTASLVMCVHWAVASSTVGDIVVRYDKENQFIICEFLVSGVLYRIKIPEKEIDTVTISGGTGEIPIADPAENLPSCMFCKRYFGTESHYQAHSKVCPMDPSVQNSDVAAEEVNTIPIDSADKGFIFHVALLTPPLFEEQSELLFACKDGTIQWKWKTVPDFTQNELSAALQLSIFFRPGNNKALFHELNCIATSVFERKKRAMKKSLAKKNGIIPEGTTFLKYFPGHGYFRGAVGRKMGRLYRIVYADQDKEDLEEKGILKQIGMDV